MVSMSGQLVDAPLATISSSSAHDPLVLPLLTYHKLGYFLTTLLRHTILEEEKKEAKARDSVGLLQLSRHIQSNLKKPFPQLAILKLSYAVSSNAWSEIPARVALVLINLPPPPVQICPL